MNILGGVIKQIINLKHGIEDGFSGNPAETQSEVLRDLLKKAKSTAFGKYYGFEDMLEDNDPLPLFQKRVPFHDYEAIFERWWKQQMDLNDITWPGKPHYFALSSGTTGNDSKRIPVRSEERRVGKAWCSGRAPATSATTRRKP